jgi:hypothetical protein
LPWQKTLTAVSPPVLRRLLSGKTKGLALMAQGEIYASFASSQSPDESARPKLYFNVK